MLSHQQVLAHSSAPFAPFAGSFGQGYRRPVRPPRKLGQSLIDT